MCVWVYVLLFKCAMSENIVFMYNNIIMYVFAVILKVIGMYYPQMVQLYAGEEVQCEANSL